MARNKDSFESRILAHFRAVPLDAAQMLFGLVAGEMRSRTPKSAMAKKKAVVKRPAPTQATEVLTFDESNS